MIFKINKYHKNLLNQKFEKITLPYFYISLQWLINLIFDVFYIEN